MSEASFSEAKTAAKNVFRLPFLLGYFLFNTSVNTPFSSLLSSNSCPVCWQKAAKSAGAPASVASMVMMAPLSRVARAFLARRMGSGHFKPVRSRVDMGVPLGGAV